MGRLILRRLAATIPVLLLVTAGVFALIHLTPGDPIDAMMAESVDDTVKRELRRDLGLDRPLYLQYATWMGRLLQGDLGHSIRNREPVIENVSRRIKPSLQLAGLAMAISLLVATPIGILSAARRNSTHRPRRHLVRPLRHLHAELPDRAPADLPLRGDPALAADLGLRRPDGGAVGGPPLADAARDHARARPRRGHHADPALEHARGAVRGLHPHRPRQGALRRGGGAPPRAQERADPGGHRARAAARHPDRRGGHHRVRVRAPGGRAAWWWTRSSRATTRWCRAWCC